MLAVTRRRLGRSLLMCWNRSVKTMTWLRSCARSGMSYFGSPRVSEQSLTYLGRRPPMLGPRPPLSPMSSSRRGT